jgi:hypothetical protein
MRVQVHEGGRHLMTPPVLNNLLAKSRMEPIEGHRETLSPFTSPPGIEGHLIEQQALLGERGEPGQVHGHQTETDSPTEAPVEQ